ncbi:MAG: hypothetical protein NXI22_08360 [bacterium]|nr:hypothetical protein [bacterium]
MRHFVIALSVFVSLLAIHKDAYSQQEDAFVKVRSAMAGRNFDQATELLKAAKATVAVDATEEFERLEALNDYAGQFWQAVWRGAQTVRGTDELVVGQTRTAVVESRPNAIILRIAGANRTFTTENMPASLALKLASLSLKVDAPENQVIVGAFHAVDDKGDREKAAAYWKKAADAGLDVGYLLAELGTAKASPVSTTEIPQLTPTLRALLKDENWKLIKQDGRRWARVPLQDVGANNEEGRFVIKAPADEAVTVVYQRGLSGNIRCQLVIADLTGDEKFFFVGDEPEPVVVPLPAGSVLVELVRYRRAVKLQLNGKAVDIGEVLSNGSGYVGVRVPAGGSCTIAAFIAQ